MSIFKKLKINCTNGNKVRQIWFFDVPVLQYTKDKNNHKKYKLLFNTKPNTKNSVFYFKFNSNNYYYSLFTIRHWLAIADILGCDYYIICDKLPLIEKMVSKISFPNDNIKFIKSDYSISKKIIKKVANKFWEKAAYAHLTSFYHAKKYNIKTFFNIDADDTTFYISDRKVADIIRKIMQVAEQKRYDCFSLDMHSTFSEGIKWNFGISYITNTEKCINAINSYNNNEPPISVDNFFNHLRKAHILNCGTFNIENLYFMHWGQWGVGRGLRLLQICKNNRLYFPLLNVIPERNISMIVADWIDNIDVGISEKESMEFFKLVMLKDIGKVINE